MRAEGAADPRRPARLRPLARGRAAHRPAAWRWCALPARRAARAATRRCCGRWRRISALATGTRSAPTSASRGAGRGRAPLGGLAGEPWRTAGDTVERLERLARRLVGGERAAGVRAGRRPRPCWPRSRRACAPPLARAAATPRSTNLLRGARRPLRAARPERGADARAARRAADRAQLLLRRHARRADAGRLGSSAGSRRRCVLEHYLQEHGDWPRRVALSAWGTSNMRTGGDDIAAGAGPDRLPPDLGRGQRPGDRRRGAAARDARPAAGRRDAAHLRLLPRRLPGPDRAARRRRAGRRRRWTSPRTSTRWRRACRGEARAAARRPGCRAGGRAAPGLPRIFGTKPGAYGAGLQALIDEGGWKTTGDLAEAFLAWGAYAYGRGADGTAERRRARAAAARRRAGAAQPGQPRARPPRQRRLLPVRGRPGRRGARSCRAASPRSSTTTTRRPDPPRVRRLKEEIGRIVRGRAANPKWIAGVMRHGYKGAFEIAATVDYLFAFAATARVVERPPLRRPVRRLPRRRGGARLHRRSTTRRRCGRSRSGSRRRSARAVAAAPATARRG